MLNKKPIIVNGFGRGGTNILMNFILSHPGIVMPSGELNKVFKGGSRGNGYLRNKYKQCFYDFPLRMFCGDIFDRFSYTYRKRIPEAAQRYIDFVLWVEKQFASYEGHNKWKDKETLYTKKELRNARLVVKAHNGLVFMDDIFRDMYQDVRFVAIIRNGYAVCEGHMRRGRSIEAAAALYRAAGDEIAKNMSKDDYLMIKFEDILIKPLEAIVRIYNHFDINIDDVTHFRLQHKPVAVKGEKKSVLYGGYDRQLAWFAKDELKDFFKQDVNTVQIARLSVDERKYLQSSIGDTMKKFGYDL